MQMIISIRCDANWESRIDKIVNKIREHGFVNNFQKKDYGESIRELVIIFICGEPEYNFKQRIKFSKSDQTLYVDIMLDLEEFRHLENKNREHRLVEELMKQLPPIIEKYRFPRFDLIKFHADMEWWFKNNFLSIDA